GGGGERRPAVRAVQRSHQRHRKLSGRTLHGSRSHRDRHLRGRLQPRLQSVLLLQSHLGMSLPPVGESAEDSDTRRGTNEAVNGSLRCLCRPSSSTSTASSPKASRFTTSPS